MALAGGREPLLAAAEQAYAEGDYRWAAELGKHLLYADPDNQGARDLQARSFEQLGYQAESGPWRNFYLSGTYELRHGLPEEGFTPVMMLDMLKHTAPERFLDVMATKLNGTAAADSALRINLNFTDSGARYHLWIENAVLHHRRMNEGEVAEADASLNLSKDFFLQIISGQAGAAALLSSDQVSIDGNPGPWALLQPTGSARRTLPHCHAVVVDYANQLRRDKVAGLAVPANRSSYRRALDS